LKLLQGRAPFSTHRLNSSDASTVTSSESEIAASLAVALVLLGTLKQIDISFAGAFVHLHGSALEPLSGLQSLTIDSDMMTGGSATAVSCMSAMSSLYLLSGRIHADERCMQKLSPVVSQLTQLRELQLPDFLQLNSEREAVSLAVVLRACSRLSKLQLSVDGLQEMPVQTTASALTQLVELRSFHLTVKGWYAAALRCAVQCSLVDLGTYDPAHSGRICARTELSNTTQMLVHWFRLISFEPV
jgi:hypothetical protein